MKRLIVTISVVFMLLSSISIGGGFQQNQHGARATALGGAFTAVANDPSAIYWNGAGLTRLSGTHFMLGTSLIAPLTQFRGVAPSIEKHYMTPQVFPPTHLYLSHTFEGGLALGIGLTQPFGLGSQWKEDWVGRYIATETKLTTYIITPTIAYEVFDGLALSATFVYSFANVRIERMINTFPFAPDGHIKLEGDDKFAYGYNFGLLAEPFDWLSLGATFRSQVDYDFEGTAVPTAAPQVVGGFPQGDIVAVMKTPMNITGGFAIDLTDKWMISADYQWVQWSVYDSLKVDFVDEKYTDIASPRLYKDASIIRLGTQYKFNDEIAVMGGVYFDEMPVSPNNMSPSLPEGDRIGLSLGVTAKLSNHITMTTSYLYIRAEQTTVTDSNENYVPIAGSVAKFNGTYNSVANIFSLAFHYSF